MAGYTKLFQSILDSTIWQESNETRILWITMLAMSDREGQILASIPGLAKRAGISIEECENGLAVLMCPDSYSRTPDHEGRRIRQIDGGWQLLNHEKYRKMLSAEERREYNRQKQAESRAKKRESKTGKASMTVNDTSMTVNHSQQCHHITDNRYQIPDLSPPSPQGETCSNPDGLNHGKSGKSINQQALEVYAHYPRKIGRKAALTKIAMAIRQHGYDTILAATIGYRNAREAADPAYTPHPATWYGQERFLDDPETWNSKPAGRKTWKELGKEADHFAEGGDVF